MLAPFLRSVKILGVVHSDLNSNKRIKFKLLRLVESICFNFIDKVISVNESNREYLHKYLDPERVAVIRNGISEKFFTEYKKSNRDAVQLIQIGRVEKEKGINDTIKIINILNTELGINDVCLNVVGEASDEEIVSKLMKYKNIKYHGYVDEIDLLLDEMDVFVMPSYAEGLPLSMIEAMAKSTAVVAYDVGGISELVQDKKNGYLVEKGNVMHFAKCLSELITNPEKRTQFSQKSYSLAKEFRESKMLRKYEEVIANV